MKSILIFIFIVAMIYIILKKATVYRCLNCSSIHITKEKNKQGEGNQYICNKCGCIFTKKQIIKKGEDL